MKLNKTLHEALNSKRKNSVLKSVFITNDKTFEGYRIVYAEAYDDTFLNATSTKSKYEKTVDYILKEVYKYFKGKEDVWLIIYTNNFPQSETLVNDYYMKEVYKLV